MNYQLAQLNIARFRLPMEHPINSTFIESLDHVNSTAEQQQGFIWRLTGDGNDATEVKAFDDPNIIVNLSVWADIESLAAFVYHNEDHVKIMRRRKEWFERIDVYQVLWWTAVGHHPTSKEALDKLEQLKRNGPGLDAFTFKQPFRAPVEV